MTKNAAALLLVGAALVVLGVGLLSVSGGLIVAGVLCVAAGVLSLERDPAPVVAPVARDVSEVEDDEL